MRFRLFWPGKAKESYIREGIKRYIEDIKKMAELEVVEIKEEKGKPANAALKEEGGRILKAAGDFVLLDEKGRTMGSVEFSRWLQRKSEWSFVLGGAYGVSDEVRQKAAARLSLSPMTFPHELVRVIFLEQLYRALTIMKGKRYHHA
jgi:23S rRNA (pseudouridine1915-N3)-methyltransferase